jgi:hypothetical protein
MRLGRMMSGLLFGACGELPNEDVDFDAYSRPGGSMVTAAASESFWLEYAGARGPEQAAGNWYVPIAEVVAADLVGVDGLRRCREALRPDVITQCSFHFNGTGEPGVVVRADGSYLLELASQPLRERLPDPATWTWRVPSHGPVAGEAVGVVVEVPARPPRPATVPSSP